MKNNRMGNVIGIVRVAAKCLLALAIMFMSSCQKDTEIILDNTVETSIIINTLFTGTKANINTKANTKADPSALDIAESKINTVRIFAFNDTPGFNGVFESMRFYNSPVEENGIISVTMMLSKVDNKTLYAIINEPTELSAELDVVRSIADLEAFDYTLASYFNKTVVQQANKTGVFNSATADEELTFVLPMSGKVTIPRPLGLQNITIPVERSLARVDIMMQKKSAIHTSKITDATIFSIKNAGNKGLVWESDTKTQNETDEGSLEAKSITGPTTALELHTKGVDNSNSVRAFWFYTPERDHIKNLMTFKLANISYTAANEELITSGDIPLLASVAKLERNKVYQIYCTIDERAALVVNNITINDWDNSIVNNEILDGLLTILDISVEKIDDTRTISTVDVESNNAIEVWNGTEYVKTDIVFATTAESPFPTWFGGASWTPTTDVGKLTGAFTFTKKLNMQGAVDIDGSYKVRVKSGKVLQVITVTYGDGVLNVSINAWIDNSIDNNLDGLVTVLDISTEVISEDRSTSKVTVKSDRNDIYVNTNQSTGVDYTKDAYTFSNQVPWTFPDWLVAAKWTPDATITAGNAITKGVFEFEKKINFQGSPDNLKPYVIKIKNGVVVQQFQIEYDGKNIKVVLSDAWVSDGTENELEGVIVLDISSETIDANRTTTTVDVAANKAIEVYNGSAYISAAIDLYTTPGGAPDWLAAATWTPESDNLTGRFSFTKNLNNQGASDIKTPFVIKLRNGKLIQEFSIHAGEEHIEITVSDAWEDEGVDGELDGLVVLEISSERINNDRTLTSVEVEAPYGDIWVKNGTADFANGTITFGEGGAANTAERPTWLEAAVWTADNGNRSGKFTFTKKINSQGAADIDTPYEIIIRSGNVTHRLSIKSGQENVKVSLSEWIDNDVDVEMDDSNLEIISISTEQINANRTESTVEVSGNYDITARDGSNDYVNTGFTITSGLPVWLTSVIYAPTTGNSKAGTFTFTKVFDANNQGGDNPSYDVFVKVGSTIKRVSIKYDGSVLKVGISDWTDDSTDNDLDSNEQTVVLEVSSEVSTDLHRTISTVTVKGTVPVSIWNGSAWNSTSDVNFSLTGHAWLSAATYDRTNDKEGKLIFTKKLYYQGHTSVLTVRIKVGDIVRELDVSYGSTAHSVQITAPGNWGVVDKAYEISGSGTTVGTMGVRAIRGKITISDTYNRLEFWNDGGGVNPRHYTQTNFSLMRKAGWMIGYPKISFSGDKKTITIEYGANGHTSQEQWYVWVRSGRREYRITFTALGIYYL